MVEKLEKNDSDLILLSDGNLIRIESAKEPETQQGSDKVETERIYNVWGSSAGARSDFFYIYRKHRKNELDRLEQMDKDWKENMENQLFHSRRFNRIIKESEKTVKRKLRRDKRKQRIKSTKESQQTKTAANSECGVLHAGDGGDKLDLPGAHPKQIAEMLVKDDPLDGI